MSKKSNIENIKKECWNKALYRFGYAYIFKSRAKKYGNRLRFLEFSGIILPLTIGALISTYGYDIKWLINIFIAIGSVYGIVYLLISTFSIINRWSDKHSQSRESYLDNSLLSQKFRLLAQKNPENYETYLHEFELVLKDEELRINKDTETDISSSEERRGMRAGLRQFQRQCVCCKKVPNSLIPTNCSICGNYFSWHNLLKKILMRKIKDEKEC